MPGDHSGWNTLLDRRVVHAGRPKPERAVNLASNHFFHFMGSGTWSLAP
jgi:hypothetical protein